jgi:hypothetical protein
MLASLAERMGQGSAALVAFGRGATEGRTFGADVLRGGTTSWWRGGLGRLRSRLPNDWWQRNCESTRERKRIGEAPQDGRGERVNRDAIEDRNRDCV